MGRRDFAGGREEARMSLHPEVKAMREWWSAESRQVFTEAADQLVAAGVKPEAILPVLRKLYDAAARDEAEGGDGVRVEAVSLRRVDLQTQTGNTDDGEAIMETTPTVELRVRTNGAWHQLFARSVAQISEAKFSEMWDAEGLAK